MSEGKVAFLFPGQASQSVGMGKDLVEHFDVARQLFESAAEILGFDLPKLCFEGPMEELTETRNAQPAILLHSLAVAEVLRAGGAPAPDYVAGHSLGEFSAAAAAGVFSAADALRIVRRRGELMWECGTKAPGTMAAVMGLEPEAIAEVCEKVEGCVVVANLNSPSQSVISGEVEAVKAAAEPLKSAGARRVIPLPVSGAFHSPLMEVVQPEFAEFLAPIAFSNAEPAVVSNVTAQPVTEAEALRKGFVAQLVSPVRWHESVAWMVEQGVTTFVEVGPGNVLSAMGAKSFRNAEFVGTSTVEGIQKVLAALGGRG